MCGIIGRWVRTSDASTHDRMMRALRLIEHRGPDATGTDVHQTAGGGTLAFGHTRLSIIDLSAGGHQPKLSADSRYSIVYNGEIYNYRELRDELRASGVRFTSESDSEVLLAAWIEWKAAALTRLRGMFAFAVYDEAAQTLTLARDGFGIKPLFYRGTASDFAFASDVRALLELTGGEPSLDLQRAYDYLVFGSYDDEERTFFSGVKHLLPGHLLTLDLASGTHTVGQWWWPPVDPVVDDTFEQATERVRELFLQNVRLHLRSDVPLGAALSGGMDSAAIVCAMRKIEPHAPINTISFVARQSPFDEEHWADLVNAHVHATPHKVVPVASDLATDIDDLIAAQGEPFGSTSIYAQFRVFRHARETGLTVMLEGQGADELFGGYLGYPGPILRQLLEERRLLDAVLFANRWSRWPGRSLPMGVLALGNEVVPTGLRGAALSLIGLSVAPDWLDTGFLREVGVSFRHPTRPPEFEQHGRRLAATLRSALVRRGLPALLRHADRNSMRWSIESRVPFLTTDLAEYVLRLPAHFLISPDGATKHIMRAALRGIVPQRILDRRDKVGFATPERDWLVALSGTVAQWTSQGAAIPLFRPRELQQEVQWIVSGRKRFSWQAWRILNFIRWYRIFFGQSQGDSSHSRYIAGAICSAGR